MKYPPAAGPLTGLRHFSSARGLTSAAVAIHARSAQNWTRSPQFDKIGIRDTGVSKGVGRAAGGDGPGYPTKLLPRASKTGATLDEKRG
jgi:hypothetical protein